MGVIPANAERNWETIQDRFHKITKLFVASKINKGINESEMPEISWPSKNHDQSKKTFLATASEII